MWAERGLLIIGNRGGTNIGGSLLRGAQNLGLDVSLMEMQSAMAAPVWVRRFNWWFRGRRPTWLDSFSNEVVERVRETRPVCLLATGIAPLNKKALEEIGRIGVCRINYLTDDPWSPAYRPPWFFKALPLYDYVFSPRRSNIDDLKRWGCLKVD